MLYSSYRKDPSVRFVSVTCDGHSFLRLESDDFHYTFGYYSRNPWVSDDAVILYRYHPDAGRIRDGELVLADFAEQAVYELNLRCADFSDYVVCGKHLYYMLDGNLRHYSLENRHDRLLVSQPGMNFPHATKDGRYLNWSFHTDGKDTGIVYNTASGTYETLFAKRFREPFPVCNHMMICPTDPTVMYFSHEGTTEYISNRLWIAEKGKEPRNIAKQKLNKDGDLGDCFGHECWAADGKGLYFVKYPCSPEPPRGICYVDAASGEYELLYSAFRYWHVSTSPDGRYLGADTQDRGYSGVCLIDLTSGKETLLRRAPTTWKHPCHPHPCFSPNSVHLIFHELGDNGKIVIGCYRI